MFYFISLRLVSMYAVIQVFSTKLSSDLTERPAVFGPANPQICVLLQRPQQHLQTVFHVSSSANWGCGFYFSYPWSHSVLFANAPDKKCCKKKRVQKFLKCLCWLAACSLNYSVTVCSVTRDDWLGTAPPPRLLFSWPVEHSGLHRGQRSSGGFRLLVSHLFLYYCSVSF